MDMNELIEKTVNEIMLTLASSGYRRGLIRSIVERAIIVSWDLGAPKM